jgi:hypothetical protein
VIVYEPGVKLLKITVLPEPVTEPVSTGPLFLILSANSDARALPPTTTTCMRTLPSGDVAADALCHGAAQASTTIALAASALITMDRCEVALFILTCIKNFYLANCALPDA